MTRRYIPLCVMLLVAVCCSKPAPTEEAPVMVSLDTKAFPDAGEHTYRVGLFHGGTQQYLAQGTYCSDYVDHSSTSGRWLSPCRVNGSGAPLKTDGTAASSLAEADKGRSYGLRYSNASGLNAYLVAMSPARSFSAAGGRYYYAWTPSDEVYVSESVFANFAGSWFGGQFIYEASTREQLLLRDRRARVDVHIECGELPVANIQKVLLNGYITSARWYFPGGFPTTSSYYATTPRVIHDWGSTPLTLVKASGDEWSSVSEAPVYLPSINYRDDSYAAIRPQLEIWLGDDPAKHFTAKVDITENLEPMMHYTYNLRVSKSQIYITLTSSPWDTLAADMNTQDETPAVIRTVTINGWDPATAVNTDDWATE